MSEKQKVIEKMIEDKKLYVDEFIEAFKKDNEASDENVSEKDAHADLFDKIKNIGDENTRNELLSQAKDQLGNLDGLKDKLGDITGGLFK